MPEVYKIACLDQDSGIAFIGLTHRLMPLKQLRQVMTKYVSIAERVTDFTTSSKKNSTTLIELDPSHSLVKTVTEDTPSMLFEKTLTNAFSNPTLTQKIKGIICLFEANLLKPGTNECAEDLLNANFLNVFEKIHFDINQVPIQRIVISSTPEAIELARKILIKGHVDDIVLSGEKANAEFFRRTYESMKNDIVLKSTSRTPFITGRPVEKPSTPTLQEESTRLEVKASCCFWQPWRKKRVLVYPVNFSPS